ncbi:MAG TPA: phosphoribosyltransferase family protein [bacterium]|nr:phosphoribosyltransferase family protein [bacterium]
MTFQNREQAASLLARELIRYRGKNPLVLAIPRGAVPMARVIANALGGEADVVLVRKLRAPMQPELAIGSIDEHGHTFLTDYARALGVSRDYLDREKREQLEVLRERRRRYTEARPPVDPKGRIVIVVDDGIATGSTMIAALKSVREKNPARLIAAAAVAPPSNVDKIRPYADQVVCLETPRDFYAVGQFFEDFGQVEDEEVVALLKEAASGDAEDPEVAIPVDGHLLPGNLTVPPKAHGIILFAHGSGSSRLSPRNRYVADILHKAGFATLLFDLLTPAEDDTYENRFDIPLLARRLATATEWLEKRPEVAGLPIGYFGASTGAAAALIAAAEMGHKIRAVVSRGGRPDLAMPMLSRVKAATLLIVGGWDEAVIEMNESAYAALRGVKDLAVVPNATHLFEEPGKLEEAARLAAEWFRLYLTAGKSGP